MTGQATQNITGLIYFHPAPEPEPKALKPIAETLSGGDANPSSVAFRKGPAQLCFGFPTYLQTLSLGFVNRV